tara:strand:+ start:32 stop:676 length:645 start_codon:yes stop_codon:yes gene_type:complete
MSTVEQVFSLFAKVFYFKEIEGIDLKKLRTLASQQEYHTARTDEQLFVEKVCSSTSNTHLLNQKSFNFLKKALEKEINYFKDEILSFHKTKFKITTSWLTKTEPGQSSVYHNHHNCYYSGVFYIDVDENSGHISFDSFANERYKIIPTKYNVYNSSAYTFIPRKGMLILFPSEIPHRIIKNQSEIARYSLSFNINPIGKLGDVEGDSFINLKVE